MTKQERIKRLSEAIEAVPEEKKDYILGIAEGMAVMKRLEKEKFADEAEQKAGQKWDSKWKEGKDVKKRPKKRKDFDDLEEKIFWPVSILWIIFALAKIILLFFC